MLDPKRYAPKFRDLRAQITKGRHFRLGDVLEPVHSKRPRIQPAEVYHYVEIEKVGVGEYDYSMLRGWQLADRARLPAQPGDIFIPHLWSCTGKWFMAAGDCSRIIVTNGCSRFRTKEGATMYLPDIFVGLSSELFAVQIRGLSTGSDGLAEISDDDILDIVIPELSAEQRVEVQGRSEPLMVGQDKFVKYTKSLIANDESYPEPALRRTHTSLV